MCQDWYFTKEKIYGDANNFLKAANNNPLVFITNLIEELPSFTMLAKHSIGGYQWAPPLVIIWISDFVIIPIHQISTQIYPRYKFHFKPFFKEKNW